MKKIARRDKLKIYGDLLAILDEETSKEKVVLTKVQIRLNVPFDRLKGYISELQNLELIENETSLQLTEKGRQYLKEYQKVLDFMKRMGIAYL
ncbi:MAG TPA: winged helix-turn-helix domain-containing protein [Candidatus Acidoferrales bacterium]|nr:winged helix-turn-helix domain-containing protein [Candidatus Acidoferrales bacterium]